MHRAVILLTGTLLALVIALLRALKGPLLAPPEAYSLVTASITEAGLYLGIRLLLFLGLIILAGAAYWKWKLPQEGLIALVASPPLLVTPISAGPALPIAISTAAAVLLWSTPLAGAASATIALLHPAGALLAILAAAALTMQKRYAQALIALSGAAVSLLLTTQEIGFAIGFGELDALGAPSLFVLTLAVIGLLTSWTKSRYPYLLLVFAATTISLVVPELYLAHALLASGLAGFALYALKQREWRLVSIRNISLLLAVCGLLFAAVSTAAEATRAMPDESYIKAAQVARAQGPVFALEPHASVLQWYGANTTQEHAETILNSRRYAEIEDLLPPLIALHQDDDAPGLRFLIAYTTRFSLVLEGEIQVWSTQPQQLYNIRRDPESLWTP
jgi:hypothetical protein